MAGARDVAAGLVRPRLLARLDAAAGLTLVVAPAGSGKTTLLAHYARAAGPHVAWCRLAPDDTDPARLAARLSTALAGGARALVLDDFDVAVDTPAEAAAERLLAAAGVPVLVASRRLPTFNLSRAELGTVALVTADDLRFRSWEVERLFGDVYAEPLPPGDAATLARRTEGWAAGLHLFHLSTGGRPLTERRRAIESLSGRSRFARSYLARTVLDELPAPLRGFLRRTCVFQVATADRCDRLLGTTDAQHRLEELERRQALTTTDDDGATFRYHEVLRRHLETALVEELGEAGVRDWYATAAGLLEDDGAVAEAAAAYLRAERWPEVYRLLADDGDRVIADPPDGWPDRLPPRLVDTSPWLSLAVARRVAADGRLAAAAERYRHAEALFTEPAGRQVAAAERRALDVWNGGPPRPGVHWSDRICAAVRGHPLDAATAVASDAPTGTATGTAIGAATAEDVLATATALLLAGYAGDALALVQDAAPAPAGDVAALTTRLVAVVAAHAAGARPGDSADAVGSDAERAGLPWLARVCNAITAIGGPVRDPAAARRIAAAADTAGDAWGALLAAAAGALAAHLDGADAGWAAVTDRARALGATTLAAWARAFAALAEPDDAERRLAAERAESFARAAGVPGARAVALTALAGADPARGSDLRALARTLNGRLGTPLPDVLAALGAPPRPAADVPPPRPRPVVTEPAMTLRCLGEFSLGVAGRDLDWRALRPRAATALRLLAMHAGLPVHRETLLAALWPDVDVAHATHNLQVAVSSLRAFLEPGQPRGASTVVVRQGDAYALVLPPGGTADVAAFRDALHDAQQARAGGRTRDLAAALGAAVGAYGGDLLPGDGPAEWVAAERDRLRTQAAGAAAELARLALDEDDCDAATAAAARSLEIDRFLDASWRLLIDARARAGDAAAAERARRGYAGVLADLGVRGPVTR